MVSSDPATVVIGTAPGEIVRERNCLRFGFEAEGLRNEPGTNPTEYEEGSLGRIIDEPTFVLPDGTPMKTRLTSVMHWEFGAWKLVHMHISVGVPDDEVAELQRRWST